MPAVSLSVAQTQQGNTKKLIHEKPFIITGGFPCQEFSHAGKRKGTAGSRYKWPEMLSIIHALQPEWVIAENVTGFVSWERGLALETTCVNLEESGYSVWPLIIPACATGAPHRRDRIWITAHRESGRKRSSEPKGSRGGQSEKGTGSGSRDAPDDNGSGLQEALAEQQATRGGRKDVHAENPDSERRSGRGEDGRQVLECQGSEAENERPSWPNWSRDWKEVAFTTCYDRVDDEFSTWLGSLRLDVFGTMMGYGTPTYQRRTEELPYLQKEIQSEKVQRKIGGLLTLEETPVLLEVVCQYIRRMQSPEQLSEEVVEDGHREGSLQSVWLEKIRRASNIYPSYRWEHTEQCAREFSDIVPELSFETAHAITEEGYRLWLLYKAIQPSTKPVKIRGLSQRGLPEGQISHARWRQEALKAYGGAIVPQVATKIMQGIKHITKGNYV